MVSLSPEQHEILRRLTNNTAIQAAGSLHLPIKGVEKFLRNVRNFVRKNHSRLQGRPYACFLGKTNPEGERFTLEKCLSHMAKNECLFYIDEQFRFIKAKRGKAHHTDCGSLTEKEKTLGILVEGPYTYAILRGKVINQGDMVWPGSDPKPRSKWHRPISELPLILGDHMDNQVIGEKMVDYWADKQNRILLCPRKKPTESIFHRALFRWLREYVADAVRVYADATNLGPDKTDIVVVRVTGDHVIEVKWLGKNEAGTTYGRKRINEGIAQVTLYLNQETDYVCGHLVVYDARPLSVHQKQSKYDNRLRHELCQPPHILFLESEPASKKSVRIARAHTR